MSLFKRSQPFWCCQSFEQSYHMAGNRGFAMLVQEGMDGVLLFAIQHRCLEPDSPVPTLPPGMPISLVSELGLRFCPWCGKDLPKFYAGSGSALLRPALDIEGGRLDHPEPEEK